MVNDVRRSDGEPHDKLTGICNDMLAALENHPEIDDEIRCIIILDDRHRGGMVLHGYNDEADAAADLFANLTALFRTMGKDLKIVPMGRG